MKDSQIVDLYWQRDEHAIRETDAKYGAYCFTVADRILSDSGDAEECVNDTWLRAWNTIPPQRPVCLRMFLAKITRNLAFDKYKSKTAVKRGGIGGMYSRSLLRFFAKGACGEHPFFSFFSSGAGT